MDKKLKGKSGVMNDVLINELNQLNEQTNCSKNYRCIMASHKDLCHSKYYALADLMECLGDPSKTCEFSVPFSATFICTCSLRKIIAINFEELYENINRK